MDAETTELLEMIPTKPENIPPRLSEALRLALKSGIVREHIAPDGEAWVYLGSEE